MSAPFSVLISNLDNITQNVSAKYEANKEFMGTLSAQLNYLKESVDDLGVYVPQLMAQIRELDNKNKDITGQMDQNSTEISQCQDEIERLNDTILVKTAELKSLTDTATFEGDEKEQAHLQVIDEHTKHAASLQENITMLEKSKLDADAEIRELTNLNGTLGTELIGIKEARDRSNAVIINAISVLSKIDSIDIDTNKGTFVNIMENIRNLRDTLGPASIYTTNETASDAPKPIPVTSTDPEPPIPPIPQPIDPSPIDPSPIDLSAAIFRVEGLEGEHTTASIIEQLEQSLAKIDPEKFGGLSRKDIAQQDIFNNIIKSIPDIVIKSDITDADKKTQIGNLFNKIEYSETEKAMIVASDHSPSDPSPSDLSNLSTAKIFRVKGMDGEHTAGYIIKQLENTVTKMGLDGMFGDSSKDRTNKGVLTKIILSVQEIIKSRDKANADKIEKLTNEFNKIEYIKKGNDMILVPKRISGGGRSRGRRRSQTRRRGRSSRSRRGKTAKASNGRMSTAAPTQKSCVKKTTRKNKNRRRGRRTGTTPVKRVRFARTRKTR